MNATICDRCGVVCEGYYKYIEVDRKKTIHLCNPCMKDFESWVFEAPDHYTNFGKIYNGKEVYEGKNDNLNHEKEDEK